MKKNKSKKNENKTCFILWTFACVCEFIAFVLNLIADRNKSMAVTNCGLAICYGCLAITYYKKYKNEK